MWLENPNGEGGLEGDSGAPVYRSSDTETNKLVYGGVASAVGGSTLIVTPSWEVLEQTGARPTARRGIAPDCGVEPNSNFANGIDSWTTDYVPGDLWPEGTYAIGPSLLQAAPSWGQYVIDGYGASNITPTKDGNVLFVNAATDLQKRVLSRAITGLVPGKYYKLVIPMRRIVANGTVEVSIDGVSSGSIAIANLPTTSWYDLPILFFTPDGTPRVDLVLRETSGQAGYTWKTRHNPAAGKYRALRPFPNP
jgi:hypothetical protein